MVNELRREGGDNRRISGESKASLHIIRTARSSDSPAQESKRVNKPLLRGQRYFEAEGMDSSSLFHTLQFNSRVNPGSSSHVNLKQVLVLFFLALR